MDDLPEMPCIKDVARFCGVSESFVWKCLKKGPARPDSVDFRKAGPVRIGRLWRFDKQKLLQLLKKEGK